MAKKAKTAKPAKTKTKSPQKAAPKGAKTQAKKPAKKQAVKLAAKKTPSGKPAGKVLAFKKTPKASTKVSSVVSSGPIQSAKLGKFDFSPLDDRILVERLAASDRTPGGLYIPDMATERPNKGRVVAAGRGHRDAKGRTRPLDVKVGDLVLFTAYAGSEVEFNGQVYSIMRESDLLGVSKS